MNTHRRLPAASGPLVVDPEIFNSLVSTVEKIELRLGAPSDDGEGGTGLIGQVTRLETTVDSLTALRNVGRGFLIGALIASAILLLGLTGALKALGAGFVVY